MKAMLIIDMPKIDKNTKNGCRNCRYARKMMTLSEEYLCSITEQSAYVYDMKCPLRPLPKRIPPNEYGNMTPYGSVWNAYIDEILGEE